MEIFKYVSKTGLNNNEAGHNRDIITLSHLGCVFWDAVTSITELYSTLSPFCSRATTL